MRWFQKASFNQEENGIGPPGFLLERVRGKLPRKFPRDRGVDVEEARAAVKWVSTVEAPSVYCIVVVQNCPYSSRRYYLGVKLRSGRIEMISQRANICHLQVVLDNLLEESWYGGWDHLLDAIDKSATVQIEDILNEDRAQKIMFVDSFSQSRMYFQLLHLLRIAPQWTKQTREDLEQFCEAFSLVPPQLGSHESPSESAMFDHIIEQNWDKIMSHFDDLRSRLEKRMEVRAEKIRGLRDGILSATNLVEASKSTSMNRHIIIFTVVTIFYLPLGFVTAVYSMSLIQDEALSHLEGPYIGSILSVAGLTYIVSIAVCFFVDRKKIMPWLLRQVPATVKDRPWFRTVCTKMGIKQPVANRTGRVNTPRPPGVKPEEKPAAKGWRNFWPKGGLNLRRQKKVGDGGAAAIV